jgi:plasmid maintenance system antidote protein VapI
MSDNKKRVAAVEVLRDAVRNCGLSYKEIGRRAGVDAGQLTRFVSQGRDLTMAVASRLCIVLGLELVQTGEVMEEPMDFDDVTSTRRKVSEGSLGAGGDGGEGGGAGRGQGRRIDLEVKVKVRADKGKARGKN